jgi:hypothetical protein
MTDAELAKVLGITEVAVAQLDSMGRANYDAADDALPIRAGGGVASPVAPTAISAFGAGGELTRDLGWRECRWRALHIAT